MTKCLIREFQITKLSKRSRKYTADMKNKQNKLVKLKNNIFSLYRS